MGKIIIETKDDKIVDLTSEGNASMSLDNLISFCMNFMEKSITSCLQNHSKEDREDFYDRMMNIFDTFLDRVFPDVSPVKFDLDDIALLYAQDMVINDMNEKHITYEEALRKYEARAKEYVRQKRAGYSN